MAFHDVRRGAILRNLFAGSLDLPGDGGRLLAGRARGRAYARYEWKLLNAGGLVVPATGFVLGALSLRLGPDRLRRASLSAAALNAVLCAYWLLML